MTDRRFDVRTFILALARGILLLGPAALAFFSGGYFELARTGAGVIAWALVVVGLACAPHALRVGRWGVITIGGLAAFSAWTLASMLWAPIAGSAYHAGQICLLYLGALLAAVTLLRDRGAQRAVVPVLLGGVVVVICYGLSDRILPGVVHLHHSLLAEGRLEQPLSYWNGMGVLAAIGLVLCAGLGADATRPVWLRALGSAAAAPLGMALYLTVSRGALFAAAAGLLTLLILAPDRGHARTLVIVVLVAAVAALVAAPFHPLTSLTGDLSARERDGAIAGVALLVLAALAAALTAMRAPSGRSARLHLPRGAPLIAVALICVGLTLAITLGAKEFTHAQAGPGAARYASLQSDRYEYWRVALDAFASQPIHGIGAGGWAVRWLAQRHISSYAVDAHSLPLQTLAELGIIGIALLGATVGAAAMAARRAHGRYGAPVAGAVAAVVVWLAHSPLDWDWQLPAATLPAVVLTGLVIVLAGSPTREQDGPAAAGAHAGAGVGPGDEHSAHPLVVSRTPE